MKRVILILSVITATFLSCDKVYINGDLDGMWQLQKVEFSDSAAYPQDIYYSFQRHLVQVSENYEEGLPLRYIGDLDYTGDTLRISGFRKFLEEEIVAGMNELERFFLYDTVTVFKVEVLDDSQLTLRSNRALYTLKKW
ncbi:MAG: lipocalin-like domain-containing protein [Bacteroidaceae bacterium]|nr:lipocalin-like domain-containing protein [Bacteroidaceae bacterium]